MHREGGQNNKHNRYSRVGAGGGGGDLCHVPHKWVPLHTSPGSRRLLQQLLGRVGCLSSPGQEAPAPSHPIPLCGGRLGPSHARHHFWAGSPIARWLLPGCSFPAGLEDRHCSPCMWGCRFPSVPPSPPSPKVQQVATASLSLLAGISPGHVTQGGPGRWSASRHTHPAASPCTPEKWQSQLQELGGRAHVPCTTFRCEHT